jgi:hypothetical protein
MTTTKMRTMRMTMKMMTTTTMIRLGKSSSLHDSLPIRPQFVAHIDQPPDHFSIIPPPHTKHIKETHNHHLSFIKMVLKLFFWIFDSHPFFQFVDFIYSTLTFMKHSPWAGRIISIWWENKLSLHYRSLPFSCVFESNQI